MDHKMLKMALDAVVKDMGMHATKAKAARYMPKPIPADEEAEETGMGAPHEKHMDPVKQAEHLGNADLTQTEMDELMGGMQR